VQGVT